MKSRNHGAVTILPLLSVAATIIITGGISAEAANVLLSAEYGHGSHFYLFAKLGEELVRRGHNVTFLIGETYSSRVTQPPYCDLFHFEIFSHSCPPSEIIGAFAKLGTLFALPAIQQNAGYHATTRPHFLNDCRVLLGDAGIIKRLEDGAYDVVVFDVVWMCGSLLAQRLKLPSVAVTAGLALQTAFPHAGIPISPAYMPIVSTGFSNRMSFFERLVNLYFVWEVTYGGGTPAYSGRPYGVVKDEFDIRPDLTMDELLNDIDMWLVASDFALEFPAPITPNVIPVGGFTAGPAGNLSQELDDFIHEFGDQGIIVFTLGTYCGAVHHEVLAIFAEAFADVDQGVVWQIEDSVRKSIKFTLTSNVKMVPWIPQNDLLGHEKTRVMVYHGGNNGLHEAIYHGVPLIIVPVLGDQHDTATRVVERGMGLRIKAADLNAQRVARALKEVLTNTSYKETAMRLSAIHRDHPQHPTERAAFWIEHVIKFGGRYMRSPTHDLTFAQLYLLDVIAFLAAIGLIFSFVVYKTARAIFVWLMSVTFDLNQKKYD